MPPDVTPSAVGSILSTLRTLPVWVLGGLAVAAFAFLFVPAFGGIDPVGFRTRWGVWVWVVALTSLALALARALDAAVTSYHVRRRTEEARRALRLVPLHQQCWWSLAKQQDDSFVSQIRIDIEAANLTDQPVRIIKANLIRPRRKETVHSDVSLPMAGSPYHSSRHRVPPHDTVTAAVHIMVQGALAWHGHPIRVTLEIIDQFGDEYRLKGVVIRSLGPVLPKPPWAQRLASLPGIRWATKPKLDDARGLPAEWQHGGAFEEIDLVLSEEKRAYAARGRRTGALGSLNVGLQSEPGFGGTPVGQVPVLLWDRGQGKPVDSPNVARLIKMRSALDDLGKDNLERYLLSHLHKGSPYAEVAYLTFLALHRMGRTVDALQAARSRLAGDKVCGYSNVLATLSAVVSHEHFEMDPRLFPRLQKALAGDTEHDFRLAEKINVARLQHLDLELDAVNSQVSPAAVTPPPEGRG